MLHLAADEVRRVHHRARQLDPARSLRLELDFVLKAVHVEVLPVEVVECAHERRLGGQRVGEMRPRVIDHVEALELAHGHLVEVVARDGDHFHAHAAQVVGPRVETLEGLDLADELDPRRRLVLRHRRDELAHEALSAAPARVRVEDADRKAFATDHLGADALGRLLRRGSDGGHQRGVERRGRLGPALAEHGLARGTLELGSAIALERRGECLCEARDVLRP